MKYTIRKLVFLLVLSALIATPFGIQEYRSLITTDQYILMAREIEAFPPGGVDVLIVEDVEDVPSVENGVGVSLVIEQYPHWSERILENFNRQVMDAVRVYEYDEVVMLIGQWDVPADTVLVDWRITCTNIRVLRPDMCEAILLSGTLPPSFLKWPGIGNP